MKKLDEIYRQKLPEFQRRLESATTTSELGEVVESELRRFSDINGEYIGSLTKAQARIALSMLEAFRTSFSILARNQEQVDNATQYVTDPHERDVDSPNNSFDGVWGGLAGGVIGGGIVGGPIGASVGAALGATGAFVATLITKSLQPAKSPQKYESAKYSASEVVASNLGLIKAEILSYLEQSFDVIDYIVAEYGRLSEPVKPQPKLEDHPEVLEFMQDFMGDIQKFKVQLPQIFQLRVQELSSILRKYGIRSQDFQDGVSNSLFEFEPSQDINLQNYLMVKPALTKGDQLILRGLVDEPQLHDS
jgi:hypothetical protein